MRSNSFILIKFRFRHDPLVPTSIVYANFNEFHDQEGRQFYTRKLLISDEPIKTHSRFWQASLKLTRPRALRARIPLGHVYNARPRARTTAVGCLSAPFHVHSPIVL